MQAFEEVCASYGKFKVMECCRISRNFVFAFLCDKVRGRECELVVWKRSALEASALQDCSQQFGNQGGTGG